MAEFWSPSYFDEVVKTLNNDPEFKTKTSGVNVTVVMACKEKASYLLTISKGTATLADADMDTKADFTFIGDYDTWVANHKGEAPLEKLVMTGKLKFKGSIPKIMTMRSQLVVIDKLAQSVVAEM